MFLDPEPRGKKHGSLSSASSQTSLKTPQDPRMPKRRPLHERSGSQNNRQYLGAGFEKPTVRLVRSPSASTKWSSDSDSVKEEEKRRGRPDSVTKQGAAATRLKHHSNLVDSTTSGAGTLDHRVSDSYTPTNETEKLRTLPEHALIPKDSLHPVTGIAWHRRNVSSGNFSDASTLKGSEVAFTHWNDKSGRVSQGTTLRGTPTPYEQEHQQRIEAEAKGRSELEPVLQVPQEASSATNLTVKAVPPQASSSSASESILRTKSSEASIARPYSSHSDSEADLKVPSRKSRRSSSPGSVNISQRAPVGDRPSSPNFVTVTPGPSRLRSATHPLHYAASFDSIDSRLQYATVVRPTTGRSLATSSSWASLQSSNDSLAPLEVPKKRLRHQPNLITIGSASRSTSDSNMQSVSRHAFSGHLSTIASESDRSNSQHPSHFSLGSGVFSDDNATSSPSSPWLSQALDMDSRPPQSSSSAFTYSVASEAGPDEPGDMTLGIFRAESAMPEPLFRADAPSSSDGPGAYHGPRPPLPPMPTSRDSGEGFDTLTALQAPSLRQKRSGYSIRQRSNSTPSQSYSRQQSQISYFESERLSHGSNLFPTWARYFYTGTAVLSTKSSLVSMRSKPSLVAMNAAVAARPAAHSRNESSWTERSITSQLGVGLSQIESGSPTSSRFLPSIFRPRTRVISNMEEHHHSGKLRKARPSGGADDRRTSLPMLQGVPPKFHEEIEEILPSGNPRWGTLEEAEHAQDQSPRLPRKYSTQKHWNQMEFPRPMSKDELNSFAPATPRLARQERNSQQNKSSSWRPPSFAESLDTVIHSRCNRQILLFVLGFVCPLLWILAAVLPLPMKPVTTEDVEKASGGSEETVQAAMMNHEVADAEHRWREERIYTKARWWRMLNRIMSVVGLLVIGAVIAIAVVATR